MESLAFTSTTYAGLNVRQPVSPYRYTALSERNNEFRLVRLEASNDHTAPITAYLQHHSLLNPPPYIALSYEVGNPELYNFLTLDGIQVPVGLNLQAALCHIRHHGFFLLWIDSLCINQSSDEEKNSQILRIQVIYQEAQRVAVWLGPESYGSWKVMQHLQAFGQRQTRVNRISATKIDDIDRELTQELYHFFSKSYWNRVWIIQEIVAGSQVSLFCGWERAEWEDLEALVQRLHENGLRDRLPADAVETLIKFRRDYIDGCSMSLLEILHRSSFSRSTFAKDKVYALLRLAFDRSTYLSEPRYGWGNEELCLRMTKSYMSSKRSLDVIFVARKGRRSTLNLPSWCPDYTCFPSWPTMRPVIKYVSRQDERTRFGVTGRRWKTTDYTTLTNNSYSIERGVLKVRGCRVATIATLANLSTEPKVRRSEEEWRQLLKKPRVPSEKEVRIALERPDEQQRNALGRMLFLYSKDYDRHRDHPRILNHLLYMYDQEVYEDERLGNNRAFNQVRDWRYVNQNFVVAGHPLQVLARGKKPKQESTGDAFSRYANSSGSSGNQIGGYLFAAGTIAAKQLFSSDSPYDKTPSIDIYGTLTALCELLAEELRLMTTHEGYIGWAHPCALPGDQIFLLTGCSMPAILRPHPKIPGTFQVVGHAYVDKMMDGSFWLDCVDKRLEDINIL
jgi:hypothetical protein